MKMAGFFITFKSLKVMKPFALNFLIFLTICIQVAGQDADSVKYKSLPPNDFRSAFQKSEKTILIDVREGFEFRPSHLKKAINIPASGNMEFTADTINKECSLFFYCTTGFRSKRVAKYFCEKGFKNVYSLDGGIVAWRKAGMPVVKKRQTTNDTRRTTHDSRKN
jgi:thioredoxin 1